jgi:hypothetical protein
VQGIRDALESPRSQSKGEAVTRDIWTNPHCYDAARNDTRNSDPIDLPPASEWSWCGIATAALIVAFVVLLFKGVV